MASVAQYTKDELHAIGLDPETIPAHVAIIMDGNGRWAKSRGFPRIEGHRRGVKTVRNIVEESSKLGISQLTLYCLSSENWKRPKRELNMLMHLLEQYVIEERSEIMRQDLQFCIIGRKEGLTKNVLKEVEKTIEFSRNNKGMRLCLAINYGSRAEIVDAVKEIAGKAMRDEIDIADIDETTIDVHLYTAGMADPDLLIRTAGEMRISNYLLWQVSYAEFWVTQKCWPEFDKQELVLALKDYAQRDRRYGGLKD